MDGIYIIYQGHVDVLSHEDNKVITSVNIFEHFGESKLLKQPSYEYLGDLYAGLYPKNPKRKESSSLDIRKLMKKQIKKNLKEIHEVKQSSNVSEEEEEV